MHVSDEKLKHTQIKLNHKGNKANNETQRFIDSLGLIIKVNTANVYKEHMQQTCREESATEEVLGVLPRAEIR